MVHIKRIELTHFKSFGGSTKIPILPGFTVVSGPNGSGKSNILDALLFCLGLAGSKGMRADRLPDLVNHKQNTNGRAAETTVSVTFDLTDWDGFDEDIENLIEKDEEEEEDLDDLEELEESTLLEGSELKELPETAIALSSQELNNQDGNQDIVLNIGEESVTSTGNISNGAVSVIEKDSVDSSSSQAANHLDKNLKEWRVTRRLRVSKSGSYSSTFYSNGEVSTATEIHEQLEKLRVYPEGYNVVLQGDVTRIISMNSRERREIIDELAGVAAFDRKIDQARRTLEKVKDREEHCHIIEQELIATRDRLAADRVKAEKYRRLKLQVQEKKQQEIVLFWRSLVQQKTELVSTINQGKSEIASLEEELIRLKETISEDSSKLDELNAKVRALGEDEQLAVASKLATQKAQHQQLLQRQTELTQSLQNKVTLLKETQANLKKFKRELEDLSDAKAKLEKETVPQLSQHYNQANNLLKERREMADAIAAASEAWVQEQSALTREISTLQNNLNPQRTEQATFTERLAQIASKVEEGKTNLANIEKTLAEKTNGLATLEQEVKDAQTKIQTLASQLAATESDRELQRDTQKRLLIEQRNKQRDLDRLEATKQAQQEAQGTFASKAILNADLSGVHGLVVQLGKVEPKYHLALETAAGGRLGFIVVEDDRVGAQGIELLKRQRAGRATFLPLNKIRAPRKDNIATMRFGRGYIDFAVNLVTCQDQYKNIFGYVFGNTIVFDTIDNARALLGKHRIVTLEGDILEMSGAMSGGSKSSRSSLRFGKVSSNESAEVSELRDRLAEIASILNSHDQRVMKLSTKVKELSEALTEAKQLHREKQLRLEQLQTEIKQLTSQKETLTQQVEQNQQSQVDIKERSQFLTTNLPEQETRLKELQIKLDKLEESHAQSEWQEVQAAIKAQEQNVQEKANAFRQAEDQLKDTSNQLQRLTEKSSEANQQINTIETEQKAIANQQTSITTELAALTLEITELEASLKRLNEQLGETKVERDRAEAKLKELQDQQQQKRWQKEKIEATQQERRTNLIGLEAQIKERELELAEIQVIENESIDSAASNQDNIEQDNIEQENSELDSPNHPQANQLPTNNSQPQDHESLWHELFLKLFKLKAGDAEPEITYALLQEKLEELQKQIRNGEKRLEAMEPVNMLALEEYEKTEARLQELTEKLNTIEAERTELLLRVEKFTTLRLRAFKEAYDVVDENFQKIFAELSEGDGHLQLEDQEDPFNGGLMLVAHPKGKPVQRLSSMSGGEKSLTALSFIFSLQKYRPSPFYAFDEVDMFLDGANVEKLSRMVKKQAQGAQFIVVSLRRPMIEASERTIGVTQARGAHTQVLGIKL